MDKPLVMRSDVKSSITRAASRTLHTPGLNTPPESTWTSNSSASPFTPPARESTRATLSAIRKRRATAESQESGIRSRESSVVSPQSASRTRELTGISGLSASRNRESTALSTLSASMTRESTEVFEEPASPPRDLSQLSRASPHKRPQNDRVSGSASPNVTSTRENVRGSAVSRSAKSVKDAHRVSTATPGGISEKDRVSAEIARDTHPATLPPRLPHNNSDSLLDFADRRLTEISSYDRADAIGKTQIDINLHSENSQIDGLDENPEDNINIDEVGINSDLSETEKYEEINELCVETKSDEVETRTQVSETRPQSDSTDAHIVLRDDIDGRLPFTSSTSNSSSLTSSDSTTSPVLSKSSSNSDTVGRGSDVTQPHTPPQDAGVTVMGDEVVVVEEVTQVSKTPSPTSIRSSQKNKIRPTSSQSIVGGGASSQVKDDTKMWAISVELLNFALMMGTITNLRAVSFAGSSTKYYYVLMIFLVFALLCEIAAGLLCLRIAYLKEKGLPLNRLYFRIDTYFVAVTFFIAVFVTLLMGLGLQAL